MPQEINSHVLTDRNPFINTAIHVLLIQGFAALFTFVPGRRAKHVLSLQKKKKKKKKTHMRVSKQCKWKVRLKNKVCEHFLNFRCVFVELE